MPGLESAEFAPLFPTPFLSYQWPDSDALNKELREKILAHERAHPGSGQSKSNIGGWHSETGLLQFCGSAGRTLLERATVLTNEATQRVLVGRAAPSFGWTIEAWANVNRAGDFNRMHLHGMSTWSGTYYVEDGDPPRDAEFGTSLEITDPNPQRSATFFPPDSAAGHLHPPAAGPDGAFSELRPAHGDAPPRQEAAHLDRLQFPQEPVSVSDESPLGVERSLLGRRWRDRAGDDRAGLAISQRLGLPEIVGRLLARRGIAPDAAERFLQPLLRDALPDPTHLKDMDRAVARLVAAVESKRDHRHLRRLRCRWRDLGGAAAALLRRRRRRGRDLHPRPPARRLWPQRAGAAAAQGRKARRWSSRSIAASPRMRRSRRRRRPGST